MTGILKTWLWLSVILTVGGAVLLYPIGSVVLNCIFVVVKIGMVAGLLMLLFRRKKFGFDLWALSSAGAVVMTIIKWSIVGSMSALFVVSIAVDVCMPAGAYVLMKKETNKFR